MHVEESIQAIRPHLQGPCIVAVSGGVDSVVLLHALHAAGQYDLTVAHVDHGMRSDADADARFVEALAQYYDVAYESCALGLGPAASEQQARQLRYDFLEEQAKQRSAQIVTAHHRNDLIETVAINLLRGTGWRGLAVMGRQQVMRPFLEVPKTAIYQYALKHNLEWCEDETNQTTQYLRNRVRRRLHVDESDAQALVALRHAQLDISTFVERELATLGLHVFSRYWMTMVDPTVAREMIRHVCIEQWATAPLTAQLERAVLAIRAGSAATKYQLGSGITLQLTPSRWSVHREVKSAIMKDDRLF